MPRSHLVRAYRRQASGRLARRRVGLLAGAAAPGAGEAAGGDRLVRAPAAPAAPRHLLLPGAAGPNAGIRGWPGTWPLYFHTPWRQGAWQFVVTFKYYFLDRMVSAGIITRY